MLRMGYQGGFASNPQPAEPSKAIVAKLLFGTLVKLIFSLETIFAFLGGRFWLGLIWLGACAKF